MGDGTDPIADDELLYRRVPESRGLYDPATDSLSPEAFHPNKDWDRTGLSVYRAKYMSIEEAARGWPGKSYYVAILRAGDLRRDGIRVVQQPPEDPGHAELPDLNASNRRTDESLERQRLLKELCLRVDGPFASHDQ